MVVFLDLSRASKLEVAQGTLPSTKFVKTPRNATKQRSPEQEILITPSIWNRFIKRRKTHIKQTYQTACFTISKPKMFHDHQEPVLRAVGQEAVAPPVASTGFESPGTAQEIQGWEMLGDADAPMVCGQFYVSITIMWIVIDSTIVGQFRHPIGF